MKAIWHLHGLTELTSKDPSGSDCLVGLAQRVDEDHSMLASPGNLRNVRALVFPVDPRDGYMEATYARLKSLVGIECHMNCSPVTGFELTDYEIHTMDFNDHAGRAEVEKKLLAAEKTGGVKFERVSRIRAAHDYGVPEIDEVDYRPGELILPQTEELAVIGVQEDHIVVELPLPVLEIEHS